MSWSARPSVSAYSGARSAPRAPGSVPKTPSERRRWRPHAAAVDLQVVRGLVGLAAQVHLDAVDQLVEAAERDRELPGRVGEGDGDRVGVVLVDRAVLDPGEHAPGLVQPGRP